MILGDRNMMSKNELEELKGEIVAMGLKLNDGGVDVTDVCPVACILIKFDPG